MWAAIVVAVVVGGVLINALRKDIQRLEAKLESQGAELRRAVEQIEGSGLRAGDRKALDAVHDQLMRSRLGDILNEVAKERGA